MVDQQRQAMEELMRRAGAYREEAFDFVREGLSHTAEQVHGPETAAHASLQAHLLARDLDWNDLVEQYHAGALSPQLDAAVRAAGGWEKLDRHISGRQLCWGLRDYALNRWGMLARTVLESWNIRKTDDFGRIVFGFIECNMMQKQDGDSLKDFEDVYSFEEAFDQTLRPLESHDGADEKEGSGGQ